MTSCDYLLLTALDEEATALSWALQEVEADRPVRGRVSGAPTHFLWGLKHQRGRLTIATASLLDMGNEAAGEHTRQLLNALEPTYLGFVGIAGAANDDVSPGAILIADRVWHYEPAKLKPRKVEHRGVTHTSGRLLLDRLKYLDKDLLNRLFPSLMPWQSPIIGTIASGEKVVAEADARDKIRDAGRNIVGFEMEGHQFAAVVSRVLGSDRWFMVRSVQDAANRLKTDEHRQLACKRAAAYVVAFLLDSDLCIPVAGDSTAPAESDSSLSANESAITQFAKEVAGRLSELDAASLLDLFSRYPLRDRVDWCAIEATAAWRARRAARCQQVAAVFALRLTKESRTLTDDEACLLRLACWADWKCGSPSSARDTLERNLHYVGNVAERGRWADLLASICRHSSTDDWLAAVAVYQQALSLKQASNDLLGVAITLQNIGFTYVEWFDLQHGKYYFDRLLAHASTSDYPGASFSACMAHLAIAWIEIMRGRAADLRAAKRHLQLAGQLVATMHSPLSTDLRRTAKALALALAESGGVRPTLPTTLEKSFWARLIIGQLRAGRGTPIPELIDYVLEPHHEPLLPPNRIEPLLYFAARGYAETNPSAEVRWTPDPTIAWPLGTWLAHEPSDALEAIRLLEGIAHLYAAVLAGATKEVPLRSNAGGLGASARFISEWAHKNVEHALAPEALVVGTILQGAGRARNALVHSIPNESLSASKLKLLTSAKQLSTEMTHLRRAEWASRNPPVLRIAGLEVDMGHAFSNDPAGLLTFRLGTMIVAVELPEGQTSPTSA